MPPHNLLVSVMTMPAGARISKRPLHRPPLCSPYAGASERKTVYVSARTPFLSAVKRVEKLLRLADRRLVQSATTTVANRKTSGNKRKWRNDGTEEDDVVQIAEEVDRAKRKRKREDGLGDGDANFGIGEEVVIKGTGKAIARVMEMGIWFQQRRDEYTIRLQTGSAACIDDINMTREEENGETERKNDGNESTEVNEDISMKDMDRQEAKAAVDSGHGTAQAYGIPETRLRYTSVLEVYVSLR
ncbi:hypothetical protein M433DRAFT_152191 [Acidomyces richmondensis BFW]|nr:MAG: hypothetical protein FE78DRAFT_86918 [Acidomyces sp. 'richmondensis']KYG47498.1 hypothetical protein M433DRAFT_152191 [Acidomyces richmondensis BFW]